MNATTRYKNSRFGASATVPCRYCGLALTRGEATVEHLVPRSKGGKDVRGNFDVTCYDCNVNKGDLSEQEFLALPEEARRRKHRWPPHLRQARARAERVRRITAPKKKGKKKRPAHWSWGTDGVNE